MLPARPDEVLKALMDDFRVRNPHLHELETQLKSIEDTAAPEEAVPPTMLMVPIFTGGR